MFASAAPMSAGSDSSDLDADGVGAGGSSSSSTSAESSDSASPASVPSDTDEEYECPVDAHAYAHISDRMYAQAGSFGSGERVYAALETLPWAQRGGRLIHFDIVHSEFKTKSRPLRGGVSSYLVGVDVGAGYAFFRSLKGASSIGRAYREICVQQGWHTAAVAAHVVSDGENALVHHLEAAALAMGQSFERFPPYSPNTNFAGSNFVQRIRAAVRGLIYDAARQPGSVIDGSFEPFAYQQAVAMYNITAMAAHPQKHSPHRILHGVDPVFLGVPFGAPLFMHIPHDQRRLRRLRGDVAGATRAEGVIAIGPRSPYSLLPQCLTVRSTRRSSRTVLMAQDDYPLGLFPGISAPAPASRSERVDAAIAHVQHVVDRDRRVRAVTKATRTMLTAYDESLMLSAGSHLDRARPYIAARCRALVDHSVSSALRAEFVGPDGHTRSYRRTDLNYDLEHDYLRVRVLAASSVSEDELAVEAEEAQAAHVACMALAAGALEPAAHASGATERAARLDALLAVIAMADLPWDRYLAGPERQQVVEAWERELQALLQLGAIVELVPGTPEWDEAVQSQSTTPCRVLLSLKRDGTWKARCVIRGDLEDKVALDGSDFSYFSNVSRMSTVRLSALRPGRNLPQAGRTGHRLISTCDVANAFLQSTPFPESDRRFLSIKSPIDKQVRYYRQLVPIYGSCSAPVRWETTFSTWLTTPESEGGPGFQRGENEPSCYWHPRRDLLMVLYVDDQFVDGYKEDMDWYYALLAKRFKIKPPVYLTTTNPIDHLGVTVFCDSHHIYLSMQRYIEQMGIVLQRGQHLRRKGPMPHDHEITDLRPLGPAKAAAFSQALGMCAWITATVRIDGRYALSRIAQYAAQPCLGAYLALLHLVDYFLSTPTLCLRQSLYTTGSWSFYSDSDMAGCPEVMIKRRSQLGYVALNNGCPIVWSSKVTSVQFAEYSGAAGYSSGQPIVANVRIHENHADVSSAAAEIYAAGNATMDFLALSYVASEAGVSFPETITLQVDNAACQAFASQTRYSGRSRLRHIDARQQWVHCLRDSNLVKTVHVPSPENLADFFTKALALSVFLPMRARMMHFARCPVASAA